MKEKNLDSQHFFALLLFSFLALNFVSFSSQVAILCGTDGIIPLIISASVMYLFSMLLIRFMRRNKPKSFYEALQSNFGKIPGALIYVFYTLTCLYLCAYAARIICSQINIYMLDGYGILVIEGIFLASCVYAAGKSFRTLSNFAKILMGEMLFVLVLLLVLCVNNGDILNMLPLFTSSPAQYADATMHLVSYNFSAAFCIPYVYPHFSSDEKGVTTKKLLKVMLIACTVFAAYYVLCISILGVQTCRSIIFPAINVMHNNTSPGILLNRYEIIIVFAVLILYFHYVSLLLRCSFISVSAVFSRKISLFICSVTVTAILLALNDRTVGEFLGELLHIKGFLAYVPVGIIVLMSTNELKARRKKNVEA